MNEIQPARPDDDPDPRPKTVATGVLLWRPEVLAPEPLVVAYRPPVSPAGPGALPQAVQLRIDAAHSLLTSLSEARQALGARAAAAQARAEGAASERERVSATMETYRIEAALDDVLEGALRHVTALVEERALR